MDYEGFKTSIYKLTNINLTAYKEQQMKRRIDSLISKNGFSNYSEYFNELKDNCETKSEFINYLTINVSEFYRNPKQWQVLDDILLPEIKKYAPTKIRVWSSACSTGDEPYTLAMVLGKHYNLRDIKIIATDIDEEAIAKAKAGYYSKKSIEKLPEEFKAKYLEEECEVYKIKSEIKRVIDFRKMNLLEDEYPKDMDIVVCRNVLIYFTEEAKKKIYPKFYDSLKDHGILFVGSTEQIIMSRRYNFCSNESFFYRKMTDEEIANSTFK
jgi:chemotaxis protein methyltransferase CheR